MATQSSKETRSRAEDLSRDIGAYHTDMNIDDVFNAQKGLLKQATGFEPKFKVHGGSVTENLALQNIQARARMINAYFFAQMLPTVRGRPGGGGLLVRKFSSEFSSGVSSFHPMYFLSFNLLKPTLFSFLYLSYPPISHCSLLSFLQLTRTIVGSANVDECLRGYLTKYDCSSADINPVSTRNLSFGCLSCH